VGSRLAKALAMLAIVGGTVFAASGPVAANSGTATTAPGTPPAAAKDVASFPVLGIPFVSGSFIGTVEVESFRAQGGKIVADTVLRRVGQKATRATLPVQVSQASCHLLQLRVGPPKGAIHPLVITQHQGNSDLNVSEFC
jgi:hypothetical protein